MALIQKLVDDESQVKPFSDAKLSELLNEKGITIPDDIGQDGSETIVFVLIDKKLRGFISLADQIRPESAEAIKVLHSNGIKTIMLTGDNSAVAGRVSKALKIDKFFAEVLPDQKQKHIAAFQEKGAFVAMTGDGVNDAPALAQADVGIAVGSGADIAAETADIILVNSNPKDIVNIILFGKATYSKMIQNLIWATAYNVFAIPVAAGVLSPWGIMISPAIGAAFMSLSTVIVAINAQLLKKELIKNHFLTSIQLSKTTEIMQLKRPKNYQDLIDFVNY